MTNEEKEKLNEAVGILNSYGSNYAAKALAAQITKFLANLKTGGSRFAPSNGGNNILSAVKEGQEVKPKQTIQKRTSLKEVMEMQNEDEQEDEGGNVLATSEDEPRKKRTKRK
jgi:cell division protein YceG involved in septum cleavage